jgi:hypothetical protein
MWFFLPCDVHLMDKENQNLAQKSSVQNSPSFINTTENIHMTIIYKMDLMCIIKSTIFAIYLILCNFILNWVWCVWQF